MTTYEEDIKSLKIEKTIITILEYFFLSLVVIAIFLPLIRPELSKDILYLARLLILLTSFNWMIVLRFYRSYIERLINSLQDHIDNLPF